MSEVSVPIIITDNTTKSNDTFSLSVTKLFALLEMFKHLQSFSSKYVYFRKLKTHVLIYNFTYYIKKQSKSIKSETRQE